jgi:hypothetical protein
MIGAPQQANAEGTTAPIGIELIGKADTLGRLVDDPGDAGGFDRAEISDVVVMRKVDNEWVDRYGSRLAAASHAMRSKLGLLALQAYLGQAVRRMGGRSYCAFA